MKKSMLIAAAAIVVVVAVAAIAVAAMDGGGDDNHDAEDGITAAVWLDDGSSQTELSGTGDDVRSILQSALKDHDLVLRTNGGISSVDGVLNSPASAWTVFRWTSYYDQDNTGGVWVEYSSQQAYDGMVLAVKHSARTVSEDGSVSYERPDIEIKEKVYFFIRIEEETDSTEWLRDLPLSEEDKKAGMWIAGYGRTANEALADAVLTTFFPGSTVEVDTGETDGKSSITYTVDGKDGFFTYGTSGGMYGWFTSFLGWSDTKVGSGGEYGTWTYWNQYTYNPAASSDSDPDYWDFNQLSFGMYDITRYHYFGLVLRTSTEEGVPADMQTPSEIPESLRNQ